MESKPEKLKNLIEEYPGKKNLKYFEGLSLLEFLNESLEKFLQKFMEGKNFWRNLVKISTGICAEIADQDVGEIFEEILKECGGFFEGIHRRLSFTSAGEISTNPAETKQKKPWGHEEIFDFFFFCRNCWEVDFLEEALKKCLNKS